MCKFYYSCELARYEVTGCSRNTPLEYNKLLRRVPAETLQTRLDGEFDHGLRAADENEGILRWRGHMRLEHLIVDATPTVGPDGRNDTERVVQAQSTLSVRLQQLVQFLATQNIVFSFVCIQ